MKGYILILEQKLSLWQVKLILYSAEDLSTNMKLLMRDNNKFIHTYSNLY